MWLGDVQVTSTSVPELVNYLASPHHLVRAQAARELVNRKEQPEVAWRALLAARADENWMVRIQVARAAVHLAAPAQEAIPALRELLAVDSDEVVQGYAAWALERLGQGSEADMLAELVRQGRRKPHR
jgi:HEAT repeat protein